MNTLVTLWTPLLYVAGRRGSKGVGVAMRSQRKWVVTHIHEYKLVSVCVSGHRKPQVGSVDHHHGNYHPTFSILKLKSLCYFS